jgi:serine kinase of HPr protein (carbohydrate metabolism regulator)
LPDHAASRRPHTVHATAVLVGRDAILLRGPSGSGKSRIALALVADANARGVFAAMIGDDRVALTPVGDRLVVRPAPTLAGRVELRGVGILEADHEPAGVVALVVDFVSDPPDRIPASEDRHEMVEGVVLPRLELWRQDPAALLKVSAALDELVRAARGATQFRAPPDKGT